MRDRSAPVPTAIWKRPDFLALPVLRQWLYLTLTFQPNLTAAWTLPLTLNRWARLAANMTPDEIRDDLVHLADAGFATVDEETEEVALLCLVPPSGHKGLQAALQAASRVESLRVRQFAIDTFVAYGHDARGTAKDTAFTRMRLAVHERDGWACLRCGWAPDVPDRYDGRHALGDVALDPATGEYRVRILELDHIYPQSLGGPFELSNLQTLCNSCNASKGARV